MIVALSSIQVTLDKKWQARRVRRVRGGGGKYTNLDLFVNVQVRQNNTFELKLENIFV